MKAAPAPDSRRHQTPEHRCYMSRTVLGVRWKLVEINKEIWEGVGSSSGNIVAHVCGDPCRATVSRYTCHSRFPQNPGIYQV